jgi:hypothetical protein
MCFREFLKRKGLRAIVDKILGIYDQARRK